jgi:arylsulfatase A-like enzyme
MLRRPLEPRPSTGFASLLLLGAVMAAPAVAESAASDASSPNVLFVTIDTLRADRVSAYGYGRATTPNLDRLIESGVRFAQARTNVPLTSPALCSMLTSLEPHEHGSTRNGLRMRSGLPSLPKALQARGYRTIAFVGNWTLRDKLSGLGEHFDSYEEVLTRRRWYGLVRGEATAEDATAKTTDWISAHVRTRRSQPFFVWVHYVEPHAPYRLHREHLEQLGLRGGRDTPPEDRYDTEVAFVDASIGELLDDLQNLDLMRNTVVVFAADHGESLGEHKYWGHGRHLYEPTLRIPMSITWIDKLAPRTIDSPALITDLTPTVMGLLDLAPLPDFHGFDWSGVLAGTGAPPRERVTHYQAHRGAVMSRHDSELARRAGLLEVGIVSGNRKEIFRLEKQRRWLFDLEADPGELSSLSNEKEVPTESLLHWMRQVETALAEYDTNTPPPLDQESIDRMRSLGDLD